MDITAAVMREKSGDFQIESLKLDKPKSNEILVRIAGAGLCHTDLSCRDQLYPVPLPAVFGHEGSGVVEAIGDNVTKVEPGDHVVLTACFCGDCSRCKEGNPCHCERTFELNLAGQRTDGTITLRDGQSHVHGSFMSQSSFATYALANETNTVKVTKDLPIEMLGPFGCGFQTGAGAVMNTLKPEPGSSIVIFGCGAVGLAAIMAAKIMGCGQIIAVDLNDIRLDMAQSLGATSIMNPSKLDGDVVETIFGMTGSGADYALECVGIPQVLRQAVDSIRTGGVCGLTGMAAIGTEVTLDMSTLMFGKTVIGIVEGDSVPDNFIPKLINFYKEGKFPIDSLITKYPLTEINQAVDDAESGKIIKAIFLP